MGGKSQKTTSEPWKDIQPFLLNAAGQANTLFNQGNLTSGFAGLGDTSKSALSRMNRISQNNGVTTGARGAWGEFMNAPTTVATTPYSGIQDVRDSISAEVLPQVAGMFGQGGFANSTAAQRTAADALGTALAPFEYDQFNQNRALMERNIERTLGRDQAAIALAPSLNDMQYQDAAAQLAVGQARDENRANRMAEPYNNVMNASQLFAQLAGLGQQQSQNPSALSTIGGLGQAGTSAALAYSLLCDRRLKDGVKFLGEIAGVPVYAFRYFFDDEDTRRIGPMADEVPAHMRGEVNGWGVVL